MVEVEINLDASPWGIGGYIVLKDQIMKWFASAISQEEAEILSFRIGDAAGQQAAEALAALVALRTWHELWKRQPALQQRLGFGLGACPQTQDFGQGLYNRRAGNGSGRSTGVLRAHRCRARPWGSQQSLRRAQQTLPTRAHLRGSCPAKRSAGDDSSTKRCRILPVNRPPTWYPREEMKDGHAMSFSRDDENELISGFWDELVSARALAYQAARNVDAQKRRRLVQ